jgi:hypothetical protein
VMIVLLISTITVFYTITCFIKIFECIPQVKLFQPAMSEICVNVSSVNDADGLFSTTTDFMILFLPVKSVWSLKIATKKKMVVVLAFAFGLWYDFPTALEKH